MQRTRFALLAALVALLTGLTGGASFAQQQAVITPTTARLQVAAIANGDGTTLDVSASQVVTYQVSGTFNATVNYESSLDNSNWSTLTCYSLDGLTTKTTSTSAEMVRCNVSGILSVRARISSYVSGTVQVIANASNATLVRVLPNSAYQPSAVSGTTKGTCTFPFLSKTCTQTFSTVQSTATYTVALSCNTAQGVAVGSKSVAGFVLTAATAGKGYDTCDWIVQ